MPLIFFLRQCLLRGGLPFSVEVPKYNEETLAALEDAKRISRDPDIQGYSSINELFKALDKE